ncbi:phage minor head protein [Actinobacillus seminis]|uniref:phage head morphogenesis protein n=1 Tax=Actinobacillus seminis TaxID=722 RepID=UPI003B92AAEA
MSRKQIEGNPLIVSSTISERYAKSITELMKIMHKEAISGIETIYHTYALDGKKDLPKGGSLVAQLRILFNYLLKKYTPIFNALAKRATEKMVVQTTKHANATLKLSLKKMSKELSVNPDFFDARIKEVTQAGVIEATSLIKAIPQKHIADVQKVLMHAISTEGKGIAELKPFLTKLYKGNERRAELTALDQTRKVYACIQVEKMKRLGVRKFKWVHSGGGREPRKRHQELHGEIHSFDDPPYIGDMHGEKVYGLPGQLPNCRCCMTPIFDFEERK